MDNNVKRECGECVACCVYLNINKSDFKKPGLTHCPYLNLTNPIEKNVLQYSTDKPCPGSLFGKEKRYDICREYECAWKMGYGAEEDRPDKSMILADRARGIENAIECKQLAPGAADTEAGMNACLRFSRDTDCVALVFTLGEHRLKKVLGRPM